MGPHPRHPWPSGQSQNFGGKTICYPLSHNMFSVSVKISVFLAQFSLAPALKETHPAAFGREESSPGALIDCFSLLPLLLSLQILLSLFSASFHLLNCMYLDLASFWQLFLLFSSHQTQCMSDCAMGDWFCMEAHFHHS